ncbi:peptidoglycan-binding domain-containing protein [Oceanicola sp. S124]|uniref:peptidoglycan-binding domain-containing protein n=1 Tax=Oceanicola sp. S124 TaxID=1042378 RepID=UPI0002558D77|nr:peptidoglycan-binding domain-containing protein [Oceanicola sp. S124]
MAAESSGTRRRAGSRLAPAGIVPVGLTCLMLTGCAAELPDFPALGTPEITRLYARPPPGSDPSQCWGKEVQPAVVETVTAQILMQPAEVHSDGRVTQPAIYKTETRQEIIRERRELWFRVPCDEELTPAFTASLQRALAARGLYTGAINGEMSARTRRAVRAYQAPQGLDSGILSLAAARQLGLAELDIAPEG